MTNERSITIEIEDFDGSDLGEVGEQVFGHLEVVGCFDDGPVEVMVEDWQFFQGFKMGDTFYPDVYEVEVAIRSLA